MARRLFACGATCFLLLSVPVKHICRLHPEVVSCVFMDDRSWGSPGIPDLQQVLSWWYRHTMHLGLCENFDKGQFTHRNPKQRQSMASHANLRDGTKDQVQVLGAVLGTGPLVASELARLQKASLACAKVRLAPVSARRKHFVSTMAAASKAVYGWLCRKPTKKQTNGLEIKLRRVGYTHPQSSPALLRLVLGHGTDVQFQAGAAATSAIHRAIKRRGRVLMDWDFTAGPTRRLRNFLKSMEWCETSMWCWQHAGANLTFSLIPSHADFPADVDLLTHKLREAWRACWWNKFRKSRRHDAQPMRQLPYDSALLQAARTQAARAGKNEVSILTGGFVSPAWFNKLKGSNEGCPFCSCPFADFSHVAWSCPLWNSRPPTPVHPMTFRFGWGNDEVLTHLCKVRVKLLDLRWSRGGGGGGPRPARTSH